MARHARNENTRGLYHVYARAIRGLPLFEDDADRRYYLFGLRLASQEHGWRCLSFCLMTTHVHLLLETVRPSLGRGMRGLHGGYAREFNSRHGHRGHLFEDRFGSVRIMDEHHLRQAARYVARNPVAAGMAGAVDEWPWTGLPGETSPAHHEPEAILDRERIASLFGSIDDYLAVVRVRSD